jgi:FKBP-type peptidyl-prolyl cis-trans isomerase FklB
MKKTMLLLVLALLCGGAAFAQEKNPAKVKKKDVKLENEARAATDAKPMAQPVKLTTRLDSASYAFGMRVGSQLKQSIGPDYNAEILLAALTATLRGETTQLTPEASSTIYQSYNNEIQASAMARQKAVNEKFLEDNKKRPGVMTTASGLQYEVLRKGAGTESPKPSDKVKVHYHGTNIDGTVFDSSVERNQPATFGLTQVIKGWTEGLQLMHVGDKFKFFIPSGLAYGDRAQGAKIKPNSTLVFEVELLEINPAK